MTKLFLEYNNVRYRNNIPPNTNNVYTRLKLYMDNVISYFHSSNINASNSSLLVKLINTIGIDYNWNIYTIKTYVENSISSIHSTLKLSDEYNIYGINSGIILNANEIVYINNRTNITNMRNINSSNWREYSPVRVKNHDFTDLYLNHPLLIDARDTTVIYDIDILGLILQYKYYCMEQSSLNQYINLHQFVGRYVLTNMIPTMCDIALLNIYLGKGYISLPSKQRISSAMAKTIMVEVIDLRNKLLILKENKHFIIEMLRNIKLVSVEDAYDLLYMDNFYETYISRVYMAMILFDWLSYALRFVDMNKYSNSGYIKVLERYLKILPNSNINVHNNEIQVKYEIIINKIERTLDAGN